jgi:hypothetical protein
MATRSTVRIVVGIAAVCLLLGSLLSGEAKAQYGYLRGGCYSAYYGSAAANIYTAEHVPYFALHPPVYYSYPVSRPYGWSPFPHAPLPYAAQRPRPAVRVAQPLTIRNPYVVGAPAADEDSSAVQPLRIVNPYVQGPGKAKDVAGRNRPQIVYPASLAQASK